MVSRQFAPALSERFVAHRTKAGGELSTTVTNAEVVALSPLVSVTVRRTRLVPNGSSAPGAGVWTMVKGLQSVATTWPVKSGATAVQFVSALSVRLVAPVRMTGGLVSITLKVKVQ